MRRLVLRGTPRSTAPVRLPATSGRVLAVDPGTLRAGFAVLEGDPVRPRILDLGVIRPGAALRPDRRLGDLLGAMEGLLDRWKPGSVAVEAAFHGKSALSALRIGEARGVVIAAAAARGIPAVSYPPATVKKSVTGSGQASKEAVQAALRAILGLREGVPLDASDALAVGLCHLLRGGAQAGRGPAARTPSGTWAAKALKLAAKRSASSRAFRS